MRRAFKGFLSRQRNPCHDREIPIATNLLRFSIVTEIFLSQQSLLGSWDFCVSRHRFYIATKVLDLGLFLGRDMVFCFAITALQWEAGVCRDRISSVTTRLGCLVSQPRLLGRDRARLVGMLQQRATERAVRTIAHPVRATERSVCTRQTLRQYTVLCTI